MQSISAAMGRQHCTETDTGDTPILVAFYRKRDDIVRVLLEIGRMSPASPGKGTKKKPRSLVSAAGLLSRSSKHWTGQNPVYHESMTQKLAILVLQIFVYL